MGECLFDLLFSSECSYAELHQTLSELGDKLYNESTTRQDDGFWQYIRDCIKTPLDCVPRQVLFILTAIQIHVGMEKTIRRQYGDDEDGFLTEYFAFLKYHIDDLCKSDPIAIGVNWKRKFTVIRDGWLTRNLEDRSTLSIQASSKKRKPKIKNLIDKHGDEQE